MTNETNPPPSPDGSGNPGGEGRKKFRFGLVYIVVLILAVIALNEFLSARKNAITYEELLHFVRKDQVEWIKLGPEVYHGVVNLPAIASGGEGAAPPTRTGRSQLDPPFGGRLAGQTGKIEFSVDSPQNPFLQPDLIKELEEHKVTYHLVPPGGLWPTVLLYMAPLLLLVFLWFLMMRQSGQLGRTALSFGKARAKLSEEKKDVTFKDVAGCDEAKDELTEIVDFLKNPKKYQSLGGRMPKGMLLVGPPGTGKTLLARAVAGEAGKPFFSLSGSDFVEMFVGVGAARVRDLFQQAKTKAPCIIFVDELDAVGRHRGAGLGGGHDEREQTLNQLLVEMDGFDATKGVIFLGATNRPDVLDPALLRPGRFDRQIVIDAPDAKGRKAVLEVHAKNKRFADDIDFEAIASRTAGFTGADLANALNEAALLAARRLVDRIEQRDIEEAVERVMIGPERRSRRLGDEERKRVAYHEAGHALVAALSKYADPVRKISIIPRGRAAGYTLITPDQDRTSQTRHQLVDHLAMLLAGRAAELLVFAEQATGAADDLKRASAIARAMVCRLGMSDSLGPVVFGKEQHEVFLGRDIGHDDRDYSDHTAQEIDREVRKFLDEASRTAYELLEKNRGHLDSIAATLLEKEVMQGKELEELLAQELGKAGSEDAQEDAVGEATRNS